jgi:hypothetical protein
MLPESRGALRIANYSHQKSRFILYIVVMNLFEKHATLELDGLRRIAQNSRIELQKQEPKTRRSEWRK